MRILLFALLLGGSISLFAQASGTGVGGGSTVQRRMDTYSWAQRPEEEQKYNIQQFFDEQTWMPGIVLFKSGRPNMQVPVIFDQYNNVLYYRQGQVIMEFVDTVSAFFMKVPYKSDSILLGFKANLPAIQTNDKQTFYEVLVDGKFSLLKCKAKSVLRFKDRDIPEEKRTEIKQLYFVLLPNGEIHLVMMDIDRIKTELPEYAEKIAEIQKREKIKLKSEAKLKQLFTELNNAYQ